MRRGGSRRRDLGGEWQDTHENSRHLWATEWLYCGRAQRSRGPRVVWEESRDVGYLQRWRGSAPNGVDNWLKTGGSRDHAGILREVITGGNLRKVVSYWHHPFLCNLPYWCRIADRNILAYDRRKFSPPIQLKILSKIRLSHILIQVHELNQLLKSIKSSCTQKIKSWCRCLSYLAKMSQPICYVIKLSNKINISSDLIIFQAIVASATDSRVENNSPSIFQKVENLTSFTPPLSPANIWSTV